LKASLTFTEKQPRALTHETINKSVPEMTVLHRLPCVLVSYPGLLLS